jgi:hypothetical protein
LKYYYNKFIFIKPFVSADDYDANIKKYVSSFWANTLYETGQLAGVIPGILEGAWDIIVSIKDLIVMIAKVDWAIMKKVWKFANDPKKALEDALKTLGGAASMAKDAANAVIENPGIILDVFKSLGSMVYRMISEKLTAWSKKIPFMQGFAIGELMGQIVFFVASLFIGAGEVAAAIKGGGLVAKLLEVLRAMKLGKVADAIEMAIESKAALKAAKELEKLNKATKTITKTEKVVDKTEKVVKKTVEKVAVTETKHSLEYLIGKELNKDTRKELKLFGYTVKKTKEGERYIHGAKTLPELKIVDGKIVIADVEKLSAEAIDILAKYEASSKRTLDEVAKVLQARSGKPMTSLEIETILKSGAPPPKVLGRIVSGDYTTLSGKELAWLLDPAEVEGLTNAQIMKRIGWTKKDIDEILKLPVDKRPRLSIKLIEDPGTLKVPTWDQLKVEVESTLAKDSKFGTYFLDRGLDKGKVGQYIEELKKIPQDKMGNLTGELQKFRELLEVKYGCNPLFTNKGFTITPTGRYGLREWILTKPDVGWDLSELEKAGFNVKDLELKWE